MALEGRARTVRKGAPQLRAGSDTPRGAMQSAGLQKVTARLLSEESEPWAQSLAACPVEGTWPAMTKAGGIILV